MRENPTATLSIRLVERLLTPVIRLCLKRSILIGDFYQLTKRLYVRLAEEEIRKSTDKINASRVSILTGLYRRDVMRLLNTPDEPISPSEPLLAKVIGQWERDPRFAHANGSPRVLGCEGKRSEFHQLVRAVSRNINPSTVLFELERNGAATRSNRGVKLIRSAHMLQDDEQQFFDLMADDIESLHRAVAENSQLKNELGHLHIRTEYDNIYEKDLPKIRRWLIEQGREFHRQVRLYLSSFDKDVNPRVQSRDAAGAKVVVSAFSLSEPNPPKKG